MARKRVKPRTNKASIKKKVAELESDTDLDSSEEFEADEDNFESADDDDEVSSETGDSPDTHGDDTEDDGDIEVEDGYDVETFHGGELESVPEFDPTRSMTNGQGLSPEMAEVTETLGALPPSCVLEFESPESVCGQDDRVRMTNTSTIPWRMICQLIIKRKDGLTSRCTGWFISPGTVMTAGHCVYSHSAGGWAQEIEVIPGMNSFLRPFGSAKSKRFRSVKGWTNDQKVTHDYGCIILDTKLGRKTGWFGFANLSDQALTNLLVNNSGYPGDKPFATQWFNAGRVSRVESKRIHYLLDTAGGQSGSPTWRFRNGQRHAVGIHAYGGCPNKSTRINSEVFANMKKWKQLGS